MSKKESNKDRFLRHATTVAHLYNDTKLGASDLVSMGVATTGYVWDKSVSWKVAGEFIVFSVSIMDYPNPLVEVGWIEEAAAIIERITSLRYVGEWSQDRSSTFCFTSMWFT